MEITKKRRKGIETAHRILECSAELFARRGFDGVSVQEIARAVGIKESSIYNHFQSKTQILGMLFDIFSEQAPCCRPSSAELSEMLLIMQPEEVFKNILFYFGGHVNGMLSNIAMVINNEKYKNPRAAQVYYERVVAEPAGYYEHLIKEMIGRGMLRKDIDARMFAEQYNYVSITLTKEYFMAKNGLADLYAVVGYMVKTLNFFCALMK